MKHYVIMLAITSTLIACGDMHNTTPNQPERTDPFEATRCDMESYQKDGHTLIRRKLYVFGKMNQLLAENDRLQAFVGLSKISTCAQAKQFVEKQYEFDKLQPTPSPKVDPTIYPTEPPENKDVHPAIKTSQHAILSSTVSDNKGAVRLLIREGTVNGVPYAEQQLCSGTIIAPRVILTAASCIYATGRRPVFIQRNKEADWGWLSIYGSHFSKTPNAYGYRHPNYTGSATDDVGLLILDSDLAAPFNSANARTRIMTNQAWKNLPITFYGYSISSDRSMYHVSRQHKGTNTIAWTGSKYYTVNGDTGDTGCHNDYGMASLRDTVQDWDMIAGVFSQVADPNSTTCAGPNGFVRETKIAPKIGWIESIIGPCNRYTSSATGISYRRCW